MMEKAKEMNEPEELKLLDALAKKCEYPNWKEYMRKHTAVFYPVGVNSLMHSFASIAVTAIHLARKEEQKQLAIGIGLPFNYTRQITEDILTCQKLRNKEIGVDEALELLKGKEKEVEARVRKECEAKRLPLNWRSNKEVVDLVRSEKKETAKEIFEWLRDDMYFFCKIPCEECKEEQSKFKKHFLPKPKSGIEREGDMID